MKVAVVILNWNGKDFLAKFLPSVISNNYSDAEIIVADNASTDDSISFLTSAYPTIKIVKNTQNGGFAKGYNDALKQIKAEYYVLLNSDVEVTANWIEPIIKLMDSDRSIAACQPKIKSYYQKTHFEYAGAAGGYIDKYGYPFCRGRIFENLEEDKGQYNDTREVFWATGACLFVRAELYHQIQGFDEDFFAHMEEIDLCWRLKNSGYKIMYCAESSVYHVGGGTLNKTSPYKTFLNFRNNLMLTFKNHPPNYFYTKLLMRFLLDGIAGLKFLLSGEFGNFWAILKAHFSFYSSFGKTLQKRKLLKLQIKGYTTTAVYRHSIIADYYLRGTKVFSDIDAKDRFL
ncbi:MAG: glycosyltransferase family 2 protein [Bacteroidota bacterium]